MHKARPKGLAEVKTPEDSWLADDGRPRPGIELAADAVALFLVEPQFDEEVLAAWRVLSDRGLVKIQWEGLVPVGVMSTELLHIHIAAHR